MPVDSVVWHENEALKRGTDNQRERYVAGILPEVELKQLARAELYRALDDFPRWKNLTDSAAELLIRHTPHCASSELAPAISFASQGINDLTHDQWERFKAVQRVVRTTNETHPWCTAKDSTCRLSAKPVAHVATCTACKRQKTCVTCIVSASWAGRELSREYAL